MSAEGAVPPNQSTVPTIHVVIPADPAREQLSALAAEMLERRAAILEAWRAAGTAAEGNVASSLSRVQFNDHIPSVLDCWRIRFKR